jgi:hypothetical protein
MSVVNSLGSGFLKEIVMRKIGLGWMAIGLASLALGLGGCSKSAKTVVTEHKMGERVRVGALVYTVFESEWLNQLTDGNKERLPQNRFLVLRVSFTNSGGAPATVPGLLLQDSKGETFAESTDGTGVRDWLPVLRKLEPAETKEGHILFEAPPGAYQLLVREETDFSKDPAKEESALIEIPVSMQAPLNVPVK